MQSSGIDHGNQAKPAVTGIPEETIKVPHRRTARMPLMPGGARTDCTSFCLAALATFVVAAVAFVQLLLQRGRYRPVLGLSLLRHVFSRAGLGCGARTVTPGFQRL